MFGSIHPTAARSIARQKSDELRTSACRATIARRVSTRISTGATTTRRPR